MQDQRRLREHRQQRVMAVASRTPRVVALGCALLRALAIEHRAVQIQREALRGRRHQRQQPAPERTEKRLDPALRKASEKPQHRILAGKPADAQHRVQRLVETQPAAVRKARSTDDGRKQKRPESLRRRDRVG